MRAFYYFFFLLAFVVALFLGGCGDSQSKSYYERFSKDFTSLDSSQKNFIKYTYDVLEEYPDDFTYALLAIAWQESSFGKNVYNHNVVLSSNCSQIIISNICNLRIKACGEKVKSVWI